MEAIQSLEKKLVEINKSLPSIPENGRKVLAEWLWVIAIAGVIFGVLGILTVLGVGTFGSVVLTGLGAGLDAAAMWSAILFGVIGMAVVVLLEVMAINPLKRREYKGWQLMLAAIVLQFIFNILQSVFINNFGGIFGALLGFAIGAYLLMQVRDHFVKAAHHKVVKTKL